jgi:hypothetical protein
MMTLRHGSQGRRNPMADSSERFEFLRARYARSFASKHAAIAYAWRAFAGDADQTNARALQTLVHRLAGSAPTYGYAELGARAGAVDRELAGWDETDPSVRDSPDELARRLSAPMQALVESLAHRAAAPDDSRS